MLPIAVDLPEAELNRALFTALENPAPIGSPGWLRGLPGTGQLRLLAAFELSRRYAVFRQETQRCARSPAGRPRRESRVLAQVSREHRTSLREWIGFVAAHRDGSLGPLCVVETGCRTHVNVDPAELFAPILSVRPRGFYLLHNHPSGQLQPSEADWRLTEKVAVLGSQLGVPMLNHAIVAPTGDRWLKPVAARVDSML